MKEKTLFVYEEFASKWGTEPRCGAEPMCSFDITIGKKRITWAIYFHDRVLDSDDLTMDDIERLIALLQTGLNKIKELSGAI